MMFGIDLVWLGLIAQKSYQKQIGFLMAKKPNLKSALLFYLIYSIGIIFFVVRPEIYHHDLYQVIEVGALFGLVCYATFDLTASAIFKNWPDKLTLLDMVWGVFLTALTSTLSYLIIINTIR
jgi:uncharacterized membrane protein